MANFLKCNVSSRSTSPANKLLYLDVLNYTRNFFPANDWSSTRALGRMQSFVDAAHQAGWGLHAFIDESTNSTEASVKWRSRREREVKTGVRMVPQGSTVLLGDILKKCGVEVLYSMDADNDDTLAFHAHADGASILSQDKDMFRYVGAAYTVYSGYSIKDGVLTLTKHHLHAPDATTKREPSKRPLGDPPAVQTEVHHVHSGVYLRGAPSPLIRELGFNPHAVVAPLRHVMYSLLQYPGPITEEWPEWDRAAGAVKWAVHKDIYPPETPDPALVELLRRPDEAVAKFFPNEAFAPLYPPRRSIRQDDWLKHVHAVRSVVYELSVMSNRAGPSLLDLWLQYESQSPIPGGPLLAHKQIGVPAGPHSGRGGGGRGVRTEENREKSQGRTQPSGSHGGRGRGPSAPGESLGSEGDSWRRNTTSGEKKGQGRAQGGGSGGRGSGPSSSHCTRKHTRKDVTEATHPGSELDDVKEVSTALEQLHLLK